MKKLIIILLAILIPTIALAQSSESTIARDLNSLPLGPERSRYLADKLTGGSKFSDDLVFETSGDTVSLQEATSGSKCMGSLTFNGTTAVVTSTTCAVTNARIFLTPTSDPTGSTAAYCWVASISNGVSFTVDCDQANDGTANWIIFKESN